VHAPALEELFPGRPPELLGYRLIAYASPLLELWELDDEQGVTVESLEQRGGSKTMTGQADRKTERSIRQSAARDGEQIAVRAGEAQSNDQDWIVSWHPALTPPEGTPHGSSGICVTGDGGIVLISEDGERWDVPGGGPEGNETWEETLRREVREEACATVVHASLLGFCRSACIAGPQVGQVLVRSLWRAEVELGPWEPQFEVAHRRVVGAAEVVDQVACADGLARIICRALHEAAIM
jgi:ADP-ribose pyrophosphatase YjhB (NUDIX family)